MVVLSNRRNYYDTNKRGEKSKLPILNSGEPAFSSDSKEVYIGDGAKNFAPPQNHKNMILNSNSQIAFNDFDVGSTTITALPCTSRYLYGSYYIKNLNTSTSNIVITRNFGDGYITINSTNVSMVLEYKKNLLDMSQLHPISNIQCGFEKSLKTTYFGTGFGRKVVPFTMDYDTTVAYPMMKTVPPSIPNNTPFSFPIGKPSASPYMFLESPAMDMTFRTCSGKYRVIKTTLNTLTFIILRYLNKYLRKISSVIIRNLSNVEIYNNLGILQSGFTTSISLNTDNCINLVATKTEYLLTSATLFLKFDVSLK